MLGSTIPIFPLPNVVLFPHVFLPLHIFEPRYRAMVADALRGDRLIGMALLCPGWEADYDGRPPVYPIGCAGLISHHETLPDGRYNIVLRGMAKFRILDEEPGGAYRVAHVDTIHETLAEHERGDVQGIRRRLEELLAPEPEGGIGESRIPSAMGDEDLVNALSQYMELEPVEKQALLERHGVLARCRSLVELLEMKMIVSRRDWGRGRH